MGAEEKVRAMEEFYTDFVEETLRSVFQNEKNTKVAYNTAPANRREEIDLEIRKQAREIGREIVRRLSAAGFPSIDPSEDVRKRIIRKVFQERGAESPA